MRNIAFPLVLVVALAAYLVFGDKDRDPYRPKPSPSPRADKNDGWTRHPETVTEGDQVRRGIVHLDESSVNHFTLQLTGCGYKKVFLVEFKNGSCNVFGGGSDAVVSNDLTNRNRLAILGALETCTWDHEEGSLLALKNLRPEPSQGQRRPKFSNYAVPSEVSIVYQVDVELLSVTTWTR